MSGLPPGWATSSVGEAGELKLGRQRAPRYHRGLNMRPYLRVANVFEDRIDTSDVMTMEFSADEFERFRLEAGDILLNEGQSPHLLGRPAIYRGDPPDVAFTNSLVRFRACGAVLPKWALTVFRHHMHSRRFMRESRITTNIAHLSLSRLMNVEFPIPPLAEQERIIAALDEEFSRLDAGAAALDRIRKHLKRMRAAVLASAYDAAAIAFGTASVREIIGDKALFADGDWVESKDQDPDGAYRLTQLADIGDGEWRARSSRFMNAEQFHRLGCTELREGDVLVARMPDPLGRACQFPGDPMPCATVVDVAILRPDGDACSSAWLMWMLNSPQVRRQVSALAKGTTRRRISRRNLETLALPHADLETQRSQLAAIETSLEGLSRVEETAFLASRRAATLRSSLLLAASSGKLVPQDPADEPASALLERMAAERASTDCHLKDRPRAQRKKVTA
jgi:restriction endonuclease S subunit